MSEDWAKLPGADISVNVPPTEHSAYEVARRAYWNAQEDFRRTAIERIQSLIPDTHAGVLLEINDTPRLSLYAPVFEHGVIDDDADVYDQDDTVWSNIDGIANDMEAGTWDEAESFLETYDTRFVIWKDPNR